MQNPRQFPDIVISAETGRPLRRGIKILSIINHGHTFTYGQPGWWASFDDPADQDGQLTDEDNEVRAAARREARASARPKPAALSPLAIRAIREVCGLSQQEAARLFGGGAKAFEKYESGEVTPSAAMTRLLLFAAERPGQFSKGGGLPAVSRAEAGLIRDTIRKSSVDRIYRQIYAESAD